MSSLYKVYKYTDIIVGEKETLIFEQKKNNKIEDNHEKLYEYEDEEKEESLTSNLQATYEDLQKKLEEAELQYQEILENAKREAELILEEAYSDSKKILEKAKEDGYQEGYNEGFIEGKKEGYKEVDAYIEDAKLIKQEALREKNKSAKELEKQIIQLVIESIRKIIHYELEENHPLLLNLIQKGLEKCTFTETLVIRVSEKDYNLVESSKNKIYMMTEGIDEIQIKSDASLPPGSIYIETVSGTIDSSIQTQIAQIETLFHELVKSE